MASDSINRISYYDYSQHSPKEVYSKIWGQLSREHLLAGLTKLMENHSIASKTLNRLTIDSIVEGELSEERSLRLLKQAIKKGYIWKFKLEIPWHPYPFINGDIVTYPWNHNDAVLYRGMNDNHFIKRGKKPDKSEDPSMATNGLSDPASIFTQGILESRLTQRAISSRSKMEELHRRRGNLSEAEYINADFGGNYMGYYSQAKSYGPIVMEATLETSSLGCSVGNKGGIYSISGLKDAVEKEITPEKLQGPVLEFIATEDTPVERINAVRINSDKFERSLILDSIEDKYYDKWLPMDDFKKILSEEASNSIPPKRAKKKKYLEKDYRSVRDIYSILNSSQSPLDIYKSLIRRLCFIDVLIHDYEKKYFLEKYNIGDVSLENAIYKAKKNREYTVESFGKYKGSSDDELFNYLEMIEENTTSSAFAKLDLKDPFKAYNNQLIYIREKSINSGDNGYNKLNLTSLGDLKSFWNRLSAIFRLEGLEDLTEKQLEQECEIKLSKSDFQEFNNFVENYSKWKGVDDSIWVFEFWLFMEKFDNYLKNNEDIGFEETKKMTQMLAKIEAPLKEIPKIGEFNPTGIIHENHI